MVIGDKIRLVRPFGVLDNVGEVYDVVSIFKAGEIYFEYGNGYTGVMSYDEFERYFELVQVENKIEKKKHEWTEWRIVCSVFYNPINDKHVHVNLEWRTDNEKRVQVRVKDDSQLRSCSSCYKDDKFSINNGYDLTKYRVYIKWLSKVVDEYAKSL